MKNRILSILTMVALSLAMVTVSSCSKDSDIVDPTPTPTPTPKPTPEEKDTTARYTVMFYGCGGGNIDGDLYRNLEEVEAAGKKDSVSFVALVKFSKSEQSKEGYDGTRYMTMTKDGMTSVKKYETSYRMDNPANLAQFITEAKKKMPAKKYVLVLWNHGSCFGYDEKLVQDSYPETATSRAVLFDDHEGTEPMSVYEVEKAIKDSKTNFDLVYLDCCNFGMVETYYQLKDCCRYIMGSMNEVPYLAGDYTRFMNDLQDKSSLAEAMKDYVPYNVQRWYDDEYVDPKDSLDLACYDMSYMAELRDTLKSAAAYMKAEISDEMRSEITNNENFFLEKKQTTADLVSSFVQLATFLEDDHLGAHAEHIQKVVEKMTVAQKSFTPKFDVVGMGITWPTFYFWDWYSKDSGQYYYEAYRTALDNSAFLKDSGWGDFLYNITSSWYLEHR